MLPCRCIPRQPGLQARRALLCPPLSQIRAFSAARCLLEEAVTETNRAERTLRRFWKQVNVHSDQEGRWSVKLDQRTLKTPSGNPLLVPKNKGVLATCVAHEWDNQEQILKPHNLPVTSLTSRAIDGLADPTIRAGVIDNLLKFIHTDAICFHEPSPDSLVRLQDKHWIPLLEWIDKTYNVQVSVFDSLFNTRQPQETEDKLRKVIEQYDVYQLAAFERAVLTSKSFVLSLALVEGKLSVEEAVQCAHVEVQSQIDRWGQVASAHDIDEADARQRLGSAAVVLINS